MTSSLAAPPETAVYDAESSAMTHNASSTTTHDKAPTMTREFRDALGQFATGITIVTAVAADGSPVGMTVSSFNSVSLEPPLILWSLALNSLSADTFRQARRFAVNVLAHDQQALSDRFASRSGARFEGIAVRPGLGGVPLIEACCAWFECTREADYPGGDHAIVLGRVERFARGENDKPLVFHGGRYRQLKSPAWD